MKALKNVFTPRRKRQGEEVTPREGTSGLHVEFAHCNLCGWTNSGMWNAMYTYQTHLLSCPVVRNYNRRVRAFRESLGLRPMGMVS